MDCEKYIKKIKRKYLKSYGKAKDYNSTLFQLAVNIHIIFVFEFTS